MFRALITATALGAAALCAGAAPAAAAAPARKTELTLSYMAEAGYARAVVLTCNPPGGGHPKPVKACNTLGKVGGTPTGLKPARTMCMMIYAPITAQVSGSWKGTKIKWTKKYGNSCEMNRANGILFAF